MLVGLRLSKDVPRRGFSCIMYHQSCQFHGNFNYLAGICHLIRNNKEKNYKVIKGLIRPLKGKRRCMKQASGNHRP